MMAIGNAVQADQFSCHVKRADPLLPVRRAQAGFQGAAANLEETGKGFTGRSPALILRRLNMRLSMQSTRAFAGSPGMHHARRWHREQCDLAKCVFTVAVGVSVAGVEGASTPAPCGETNMMGPLSFREDRTNLTWLKG